MVAPAECPVESYARKVVAGEIVAGRLVRLACERHLRDLVDGSARGLRWDGEAAQRGLRFFKALKLAEGKHAGQPFELQPWQCFVVGSLLGWKLAEDGSRRFRRGYWEIGKGNGKSPMAAGLGLYGMLADGEMGAEIYSAAVTQDQARILWNDAVHMVEASPLLKSRVECLTNIMTVLQTRSIFKPVSSEAKSLDGKRVHMAFIDELHEHPTALVTNKISAGTKGRTQALIIELTNSGCERASVCWQHHEYGRKILEGTLQDDSWFVFICGLDPCPTHLSEGKSQPVDGCADCDDFRDERVWQKANPNLGVSITHRYLREQVREAEGMPTQESLVKRLNFCIWVDAENTWLSADLWAKGAGPLDLDDLKGRTCFGGLDIASQIDVTAFVLCYPDYPEEGTYALLPHFWIPRKGAEERSHKDNVPWLAWAREGYVTLTDGDAIDQDVIEQYVKDTHDLGGLVDVAFDQWNATQMATHLQQHGVSVVRFRQTGENFNEPTKHFEALLKSGRLRHGSHPVLDWMAGNVAVLTDRSGNVRPVKPAHDSPKKVDGIVAAVMALGRAMLAGGGVGGGVEFW